ncbi:MAG: methylenetetrahydrofolate reductase, partial [Gammaproteobacteria bacterium]
MPITNLAGIKRFSAVCGADIPRWILRRLESLEDDSDSLKAFGEEVVTSLCEQLIQGGVPGLHFYTLNQSKPTLRLCKNLGY